MLKTCWTQVEKAPPFQPFQQRKVINTHINISCPHFVDYYMHFRLPIGHKKMSLFYMPAASNMFQTFFQHGLSIFCGLFFARMMYRGRWEYVQLRVEKEAQVLILSLRRSKAGCRGNPSPYRWKR